MSTRTGGSSIGRDLAQIVLSSRPISWINTAFPFAAAYLLSTREVDLTLVIGTLYFLIPYNLAMYGINDVFDYASDLANPRKGGIEGALLCPSHPSRNPVGGGRDEHPVPRLSGRSRVSRVLGLAGGERVRRDRVLRARAPLQGTPVPRLDHLEHALREPRRSSGSHSPAHR